jgi:hypothetical protein
MGTVHVRIVSGDDWEREILALLGRRYPPGDFVEVPANDRGDLGMDGIGRDGVIYQCYSPNEPCSNSVRKTNQKNKIREDLNKLIQNQEEHQSILGGILVRRWMLVVPYLTSKDVQVYANAQADRIRAQICPYISNDFAAVVCTDSFLSAERSQLVRGVLSRLQLTVDEPSDGSVKTWSEQTASIQLVVALRGKLKKLVGHTPGELQEIERKYLHRYLLADALQKNLEGTHPQIYEAIARTKNAFELKLQARSEICDDRPSVRLLAALEEYEDELQRCIATDLDEQHIVQIAQGDVADWLMRCPLSFKTSAAV